jgi:hypothetical protein
VDVSVGIAVAVMVGVAVGLPGSEVGVLVAAGKLGDVGDAENFLVQFIVVITPVLIIIRIISQLNRRFIRHTSSG